MRCTLHLLFTFASTSRALFFAASGHPLLGATSAHISVLLLNMIAVASVRLGPRLHTKLLLASCIINGLVALMHLIPLSRQVPRERFGLWTGLCLPAMLHASVCVLCVMGVCGRGFKKPRKSREHVA